MRPRNARQLHRAGIVQNYGPKAARPKRELRRAVSSVRKVLFKRPGTLVLWIDRDWRQARANGAGFFSTERLNAPYRGRIIAAGSRAILILKGRAPE